MLTGRRAAGRCSDLGHADVGFTDHPPSVEIVTPTMDTLVQQGVRLERAPPLHHTSPLIPQPHRRIHRSLTVRVAISSHHARAVAMQSCHYCSTYPWPSPRHRISIVIARAVISWCQNLMITRLSRGNFKRKSEEYKLARDCTCPAGAVGACRAQGHVQSWQPQKGRPRVRVTVAK